MTRKIAVLLALTFAVPAAANAAGPKPIGDAAFASELGNIRAFAVRHTRQYQEVELDNELLVDLLEDWRDDQVRRAALRSIRGKIQNSEVLDAVLDIATSWREKTSIRVEAIHTLYGSMEYEDVREAVIDMATKRSEENEVRAASFRLLHRVAATDADVRSELVRIAEKAWDTSIQIGAIWALRGCIADQEVKDIMIELAEKRREQDQVRIAAIYSLAPYLSDPEVKECLTGLASRTSEDEPVRVAAVNALMGRRYAHGHYWPWPRY